MFMTDEDLQLLTGYVRNSDRCRWLSEHGWTFVKSVAGKPIVSKAHAEVMLSGANVRQMRPEPRLNMAALRG